MKKLPIILLIPFILACSVKGKFEDETTLLIDDLKDQRKTDSLLFFLRAENPVHRREAALAFGSVQDSAASAALGNALLEDKDVEVRRNAAFALGQTSGNQAVIALIPALEDKERAVVREVLEALGKCVRVRDLGALQAYESNDTLLQEGKAWALYRLALRGVTDGSTSKIAAHFLSSQYSYQTRLAAAHFFGRIASAPPTGFEEHLVESALNDKRPEVRMAALSGMKYVDYRRALPVLTKVLNVESDYRVRVNAVRVSFNFVDSSAVKSLILQAVSDSNEMVQTAASEVVRRVAEKLPIESVSSLVQSNNIRVKANLYAAILRAGATESTMVELLENFSGADAYDKSFLLSALGEAKAPLSQKAFEMLSLELEDSSSEKVILTTAASALVTVNRNTKGEIPASEFLEVYKRAIANGDPGVIAILSSALSDETLGFKKEIDDVGFLSEARSKLKLPKDVESIEPLERAIAYLSGKEKPAPLKNEFNHPIDWKLAATIAGDEKAEIITSKGTIVIRLLVEDAPGSVANFVELAKRKYFDGKHVHRVVPNFVIQDGCNRGDGFGSEDYSIRSEFSLKRYGTGSVGMASAGKDTEGTQWFITHSPTPHLDGRYTIFAEVESGIETVHQLGVGDKILEVKVKSK